MNITELIERLREWPTGLDLTDIDKAVEALLAQQAVIEKMREALVIANDMAAQSLSGYGFYRPDNPHNFCPDFESCTPEEIANHSAACEAYDKGTYVPNHSDGWISESVHVTTTPWGIGTYTDEIPEVEKALALQPDLSALREHDAEVERRVLANAKVKIPTDTMEQAFAREYDRGYAAGKAAAERIRKGEV